MGSFKNLERERESQKEGFLLCNLLFSHSRIELGDSSIYRANDIDSITCCFLFSLGLKEKPPSYQCPQIVNSGYIYFLCYPNPFSISYLVNIPIKKIKNKNKGKIY